MTLVIKPEYRNIYPAKMRDKQLQFVSASFNSNAGTWAILVTTPDGEFWSVKSIHLTKMTKLEVALG